MDDVREAVDLLRVAREALLEEILPGLDGKARYQALMVARAMEISARLAERDEGARRDESAGIESLPHRRALCMRIREGYFDPPGARRDVLLSHLADTVRDRLRIDNPRLVEER